MIHQFQRTSFTGVIFCKNCIRRETDECPMRFVEHYYNKSWEEWDDIVYDNTTDNGYCDRGIAEI